MPSPQHDALVQQLRENPLLGETIEETRAGFEQLGESFPVDDDVACEKVSAGGVEAEWVIGPGADPSHAILYLHGGGYVIGSLNTHRNLAGRISKASGARVLLLGYRLAPENPHPAAVEDATAAYRWMLDQGLEPGKLVIAGDSAGGGLTVATLVALRDQGVALPAAGVCLSPWIDLEGLGESMTHKADADPMVSKEALLMLGGLYLNGADPKTPLAAPLHADLTGLPPLMIQVGTAETLLDDAHRLEAKCREVQVPVEIERWDDVIHVFQLFPMLPEADDAVAKIGAFVKSQTRGR